MKLLLLILISVSYCNAAFAQSVVEFNIEIGRGRKITKVEVQGNFPAEDSVWKEQMAKSLRASGFVAKRARKGKYIVRVGYVIAKDGTISDVRCVTDPGYGICKEAVRVVKKGPTWKPAAQNGRQVMTLRK
jgi:protein TonB